MLRVIVYFADPVSPNKPIELTGLSKRINVIGMQPIPGDQFNYEDLSKDDKEKIGRFLNGNEKLAVKSRQFKFENTYSAIYIELVTAEVKVLN